MTRRPWWKRAILLTGSVAASLLAAEGFFRALGPDPGGFGAGRFYTTSGLEIPVAEIANFLRGGGYMGGGDVEPPRAQLVPSLQVKQGYDRPRWDYFDAQGCIVVQHNSRGFRDDEFPVQKPAGEFRVLALGDSFTWGSGVLAEDAWPSVVERHLRARGPAQVVNCGFACGYNPSTYDDWVRSDGLLLSPDLVIVGLCLNDMGRDVPNVGNDVPMLGYAVKKPEPCVSKLVEYALATWEWRQAKRQTTDFAARVRAHPETWNATQESLRSLKAICDDAGIPLVVAVFPMLSQLDFDPYPYAGLVTMAVDFCRAAGIACVDATTDFVGRDDEMDLWVHPTDQHPNDVAQRMLGDRIYAFLRDRRLIPKY